MEILIPGEEAFGEAIPSISQFIHFIRANRVRVGDGNELDARWSEGVEARQLAAARRESERKRLDAVSKEIAPRQRVPRIELFIDLGDEAGQVVERRRNNRCLPARKVGRGPGMSGQKLGDHRIAGVARG